MHNGLCIGSAHRAGRHGASVRPLVVAALDGAGIDGQMVIEPDNDSAIHATVSADLAVHTTIEGTGPPQLERIDHGGALPDLPAQLINLYTSNGENPVPLAELAGLLTARFAMK